MSDVLRRRYEVLLRRAEAQLAGAGGADDGRRQPGGSASEADAAIVRAATSAERQRLLALRADGTIGDAAFQQIEQELDWRSWTCSNSPDERTDRGAVSSAP